MSIGRISTFLDIYIERDMREGTLDESRRAGADRPARAEAAHRPLPAHAGIRRAVQRRPLLGDRMRRRHGPRRAAAGHAHQLPHAAHADQSRPGARAQHHRALVAAICRTPFKRYCITRQPRHLVAPVRERRPDAALLGRRLRHRLLRLGHAARQADAVLRRAGEPRQGAALRHQRRPRRDQRRPGRPAFAARDRATCSTTTR